MYVIGFGARNDWVLSSVLALRLTLLPALLIILFLGAGCAHKAVNNDVTPLPERLAGLKVKGAVELKIGAEPGRTELVKYLSRTLTQSLEGKDVRHQEERKAAFTVETKTGAWDEKGDLITQSVRTVEKLGELDLRSMAMPELGESIGIILSRDGGVVNVDGYPKGTLFYVAPISLPKGVVEVGDTWDYSAQWLSLEESAPFQLDMISILKGFVTCGQSDECADIEISGEVRLSAPIDPVVVSFKNVLAGRILFARKAGVVVWSRIDSLETLQASSGAAPSVVEQLNTQSGPVVRRVHSCLEGILVEPPTLKVAGVLSSTCDEAKIPASYRDL